MKRKAIVICATILTLIILIIVVPIVINECYKTNAGYTTVWDGADVLSTMEQLFLPQLEQRSQFLRWFSQFLLIGDKFNRTHIFATKKKNGERLNQRLELLSV